MVVIDNHRIIGQGIGSLLDACRRVSVLETIHQVGAAQRVKQLEPDIALLNLVSGDNAESLLTIAEIRHSSPDTQLLILANSGSDPNLLECLKMGAMGCLLADSTAEDLVESICEIAAGGVHLPTQISRHLLERMSDAEDTGEDDRILSPQQLKVLKFISRGLANKDIAQQMILSTRTVEMHIYRLFKTLNVNSRTQAVTVAIQMGIIEIGDIQEVNPGRLSR